MGDFCTQLGDVVKGFGGLVKVVDFFMTIRGVQQSENGVVSHSQDNFFLDTEVVQQAVQLDAVFLIDLELSVVQRL